MQKIISSDVINWVPQKCLRDRLHKPQSSLTQIRPEIDHEIHTQHVLALLNLWFNLHTVEIFPTTTCSMKKSQICFSTNAKHIKNYGERDLKMYRWQKYKKKLRFDPHFALATKRDFKESHTSHIRFPFKNVFCFMPE